MKYIDGCEHGENCFIASFETEGKEYDLYIFSTSRGDEVCIRYGNNGHEYYSPSTLDIFLSNTRYEPYNTARIILLKHGVIRYEPGCHVYQGHVYLTECSRCHCGKNKNPENDECIDCGMARKGSGR